jgi:hypothetical protein
MINAKPKPDIDLSSVMPLIKVLKDILPELERPASVYQVFSDTMFTNHPKLFDPP